MTSIIFEDKLYMWGFAEFELWEIVLSFFYNVLKCSDVKIHHETDRSAALVLMIHLETSRVQKWWISWLMFSSFRKQTTIDTSTQRCCEAARGTTPTFIITSDQLSLYQTQECLTILTLLPPLPLPPLLQLHSQEQEPVSGGEQSFCLWVEVWWMSFSLRYFQDKQSLKTGNDAAQQKSADR